MDEEYKKDKKPAKKRPKLKRNRVAVETKATSVVYKIAEKYTVKSDNQAHKVTIMDRKFKANFQYTTTPKLSRFAYLKAKVRNDSGYSFIGGRSNIFLDNSFVTNSVLKSVAPNEEFVTYLGVDEGVKVEYKFIKKHENKEGVFSKMRKIEFEYLIKITNNKKQKLDLVVRDQLPISSNEKLKVKLIEPAIDAASKNIKVSKTRFIEWKFDPRPGEELKIPFRFSVELPADENFKVDDPLFGLIR